MSIFRSTFSPSVKTQLGHRQKAITNRTPQNLQYLNSRNAWIRMSSSVNVNGTNELAKKYILQGGIVKADGTARSGIGTFDNAYSNTAADGTKYQRGIRPMPGITNMDIKSLSAYGSLREITLNFQCWDIKQLEDLELLYMRPGYTVLVEWGWTPYINNNGEYKSTFTDYYDIINKPQTDRTVLFKDLYDKSVQYGGNYDAMFGYIKNYQWSARPDGGYDCQTNIISTGEIIESLKINYLLPEKKDNPNQGLLKDEFTNVGNDSAWIAKYQKNVLAGIWAEMYYKVREAENTIIKVGGSSAFESGGVTRIPLPLSTVNPNPESLALDSQNQVYISLGSMLNILNKYITAKSKIDGQPLVKLSLKSNEYENTSEDLLCTAHPLQVSVDPSICLIKSPVWYEDGGSNVIQAASGAIATDTSRTIAQNIYNQILNTFYTSRFVQYTDKQYLDRKNSIDKSTLGPAISLITDKDIYNSVENLISQNYPKEGGSTLTAILNKELENNKEDLALLKQIQTSLSPIVTVNYKSTIKTRKYFDQTLSSEEFKEGSITLTPKFSVDTQTATSQQTILQNAQKALSTLTFLKDLPNKYFYNDTFSEIGIIKNIYVNVDYLYLNALDSSLEGSDPKEKNEINLYNYLKKIISNIQSAIGNVSSFEIHVDPISNDVARIIDVNYTEPNKSKYEELFPLEVHNLNSVVRSYSLQSQIFPNQSSAIAIGAQAKGGQLGMQNNTTIDFNRNLTDRIIPEKVDGINSPTGSVIDNKPTITNGIAQIVSLFSALSKEKPPVDSGPTKVDYSALASGAKNSLHDVIAYFQTVTKSPGSNRNLIPTKFSAEMDGIGGLVIGHMFRLPDNIMPKGYRGVDGVGVKLGNAITRIGHSIGGGDWTTKIETLNIVLEDPVGGTDFNKLDLSALKEIIEISIGGGTNTGGKAKINANTTSTFGQVDKSIPNWGRAILDMLAYTEGTARAGQNGYDTMFAYNTVPNWTSDTTNPHPNLAIKSGGLTSTASGRYQFLYGTWKELGGGKNLPFNKVNQDTLGLKIIKQRIPSDTVGQEAYSVAKSGVTDVNLNPSFLSMLGIGKKGLAGGWASVCDRFGRYQYAGQSTPNGTQDIYNIYIEAVKKNS